jgi:hypothetical protein
MKDSVVACSSNTSTRTNQSLRHSVANDNWVRSKVLHYLLIMECTANGAIGDAFLDP